MNELNPRYSELPELHGMIQKLIPTENPDRSGRNLFWIRLDESGEGMDMNAVRETMRDKDKRNKAAAAFRDYAKQIDRVVKLLSEADL